RAASKDRPEPPPPRVPRLAAEVTEVVFVLVGPLLHPGRLRGREPERSVGRLVYAPETIGPVPVEAVHVHDRAEVRNIARDRVRRRRLCHEELARSGRLDAFGHGTSAARPLRPVWWSEVAE